jgi:hypothetical protein
LVSLVRVSLDVAVLLAGAVRRLVKVLPRAGDQEVPRLFLMSSWSSSRRLDINDLEME